MPHRRACRTVCTGPLRVMWSRLESIEGAVAMFDLMGKRVAADMRGMERLA